jgi:hypothetical protein
MDSKEMRATYAPARGSKLDRHLAEMSKAEKALAGPAGVRQDIERRLNSARIDATQLANEWTAEGVRALIEAQALMPILERQLASARAVEREAATALQAASLESRAAAKALALAATNVRDAEAEVARARRADDMALTGEAHNPWTDRDLFQAEQGLRVRQWELERLQFEWLASPAEQKARIKAAAARLAELAQA